MLSIGNDYATLSSKIILGCYYNYCCIIGKGTNVEALSDSNSAKRVVVEEKLFQ